jgi:hypothetical protein
MKDFAESRYNIPTSMYTLARAFDCPRPPVKSALAHGLYEPGPRGKPTALDDDRDPHILDWVIAQSNPKSRSLEAA